MDESPSCFSRFKFLILTVFVISCSQGPVEERFPASIADGEKSSNELLILDQGDEFAKARKLYYSVSQGSLLIPFEWYLALETPDSKEGKIQFFNNDENIYQIGFIKDKENHPNYFLNQDESEDWNQLKKKYGTLPIGFTVEENFFPEYSKFAHSDYSLDPRKFEQDFGLVSPKKWMGITCAACHTAQLEYPNRDPYDGTKRGSLQMRVDGAGNNVNFQKFVLDLKKSLEKTWTEEERFNRFVRNLREIYQAFDGTEPDPSQLKEEMKKHTKFMNEIVNTTLPLDKNNSRDNSHWGYGRIDALSALLNNILGVVIEADNYINPDRPVDIPHIWHVPYFDWAQWNSSVGLPPARNGGEVMGVFGKVKVVPEGDRFSSINSINFHNLKFQEQWVRVMKSPRYPEEKLGRIDQEMASKGKILYKKNCLSCHGVTTNRPDNPTPEQIERFAYKFDERVLHPTMDPKAQMLNILKDEVMDKSLNYLGINQKFLDQIYYVLKPANQVLSWFKDGIYGLFWGDYEEAYEPPTDGGGDSAVSRFISTQAIRVISYIYQTSPVIFENMKSKFEFYKEKDFKLLLKMGAIDKRMYNMLLQKNMKNYRNFLLPRKVRKILTKPTHYDETNSDKKMAYGFANDKLKTGIMAPRVGGESEEYAPILISAPVRIVLGHQFRKIAKKVMESEDRFNRLTNNGEVFYDLGNMKTIIINKVKNGEAKKEDYPYITSFLKEIADFVGIHGGEPPIPWEKVKERVSGYKARPLDGIWSTPPYLHNGSVPNLYELLSPPSERSKSFVLGSSEFDPMFLGLRSGTGSKTPTAPCVLPQGYQDYEEYKAYLKSPIKRKGIAVNTKLEGNLNTGMHQGWSFSHEEKCQIIEFIKTL